MLNILDKIQSHPLYGQARDIRSLGLIVFAVIVLLVSWSGVKAIQVNYKLEQQISNLQQQNGVQELENDNQRLKNEYYNTPQYLELAARQNFGLAMPGEKELIVPKEVAAKYVEGVAKAGNGATPAERTEQADKNQIFFVRNLHAWMDFFLHRD